jgi:hypothetical protein
MEQYIKKYGGGLAAIGITSGAIIVGLLVLKAYQSYWEMKATKLQIKVHERELAKEN